jgi:hypothetical protein
MKQSFFADFADNVIEYSWTMLCEQYSPSVTLDSDVLATAPNMKEVGANVLY